jgi:hypothetical protein
MILSESMLKLLAFDENDGVDTLTEELYNILSVEGLNRLLINLKSKLNK